MKPSGIINRPGRTPRLIEGSPSKRRVPVPVIGELRFLMDPTRRDNLHVVVPIVKNDS